MERRVLIVLPTARNALSAETGSFSLQSNAIWVQLSMELLARIVPLIAKSVPFAGMAMSIREKNVISEKITVRRIVAALKTARNALIVATESSPLQSNVI